MSAPYAVVLQNCPEDRRGEAAAVLGRAFSIKETTCQTVLESTPIIVIDKLDEAEAAAASLALRPLMMAGAELSIRNEHLKDLPKIDWPKQPSIYKRSLANLVQECHMQLAVPGHDERLPLIDLLIQTLTAGSGAEAQTGGSSGGYEPQEAGSGVMPAAQPDTGSGSASGTKSRIKEFKGADLPEITPFSSPSLASQTPPGANATTQEPTPLGERMDQVFGNDEGDGDLVPSNNDITSILDRLLPDEEPDTGHHDRGSSGNRPAVGGFSLFLTKINDENRRNKAIPLIVELAGIGQDEASALVKKIIIPVLRNVSQEDAEAAKQRFAEIGVLARIKDDG